MLLKELFQAIRDELLMLHRVYGLAKDSKLSSGGVELKVWINEYIGRR